MQSKRELRVELRARRRSLSPTAQRQHAARLVRHILSLPSLRTARHIAAYWPADGEIDPREFINFASQRGIQMYLPVIGVDGVMHFAKYNSGDTLKKNTYGIPEPQWRRKSLKALWQLDVLLMPLVGFDVRGNRLGMGGGFYDRAIAAASGRCKQPQRWGLAHSCQRVQQIPVDSRDMPLRGVITEQGYILL